MPPSSDRIISPDSVTHIIIHLFPVCNMQWIITEVSAGLHVLEFTIHDDIMRSSGLINTYLSSDKSRNLTVHISYRCLNITYNLISAFTIRRISKVKHCYMSYHSYSPSALPAVSSYILTVPLCEVIPSISELIYSCDFELFMLSVIIDFCASVRYLLLK